MFEVRFHGRGGQGAKSASQFLVEAALTEGKHIQAYPDYGPERSGAPVRTYARIADDPIITHEPVTSPEAVVVLDPTLMDVVDVIEGLGSDGTLIVNSKEHPDIFRKKLKFKGRVYTLDASTIALKLINRDSPNTALLGALVKAIGVVELESMKQAVVQGFLKKLGKSKAEHNGMCVQEGYEKLEVG
ncbi:2-oxoacid:acceptor oxidoreductase family protein [Patescibacteria group bacterium]|nr:2-oxoacid:acceptor oxidoreductase family protein [Patescibacteria group bacterium]MCG2692938.1 2-oxoacid:acceptor oxidoreductase family protein [Candidatus Parcubacteria bacterium]